MIRKGSAYSGLANESCGKRAGISLSVRCVRTFLLAATILTVIPSIQGATTTWTANGPAGDWGHNNNWSNVSVPTSADSVLFDNTHQVPLENVFLDGSRTISSVAINLTVASNQSWSLGADDSTGAFTLTLVSGNISVLNTSGAGTYVIGATSGNLLGPGILTLATTASGFTFDNSRTNGGVLEIHAVVSGASHSVTKTGAGTVTLQASNTFTGSTAVDAGTLKLAAGSGSALQSTSSITVHAGGTLLLGANHQIHDTAPMVLAGGTFAKGDFSEGAVGTSGVGALTLSGSGSHLDFGTGVVGTLAFASFNPAGFNLTINNWTGTGGVAGNASTDRLILDSDQSGNLSHFIFTGYGSGATEIALGGGYYEVVPLAPIPEPSTYFVAVLVAGVLGSYQWRRFRSAQTETQPRDKARGASARLRIFRSQASYALCSSKKS